MFNEIETIFSEYKYGTIYIQLKYGLSDNVEFVVRILQFCLDAGKGNITMPIKRSNEYLYEGRTHVVVFDFDGTLTQLGKIAKTTWESLWVSLGYDIKECQDLHRMFDRKEITHEEWCYLIEKNLKREIFIGKWLKRYLERYIL